MTYICLSLVESSSFTCMFGLVWNWLAFEDLHFSTLPLCYSTSEVAHLCLHCKRYEVRGVPVLLCKVLRSQRVLQVLGPGTGSLKIQVKQCENLKIRSRLWQQNQTPLRSVCTELTSPRRDIFYSVISVCPCCKSRADGLCVFVSVLLPSAVTWGYTLCVPVRVNIPLLATSGLKALILSELLAAGSF